MKYKAPECNYQSFTRKNRFFVTVGPVFHQFRLDKAQNQIKRVHVHPGVRTKLLRIFSECFIQSVELPILFSVLVDWVNSELS